MIRAVEGRAAYHHAWDTGLDKQCPDIIDGDAQLVFIDGKGMPGYRARIDKRNESHPLVGARMDDTTMPIKAGIAVLVVCHSRVGVHLQYARTAIRCLCPQIPAGIPNKDILKGQGQPISQPAELMPDVWELLAHPSLHLSHGRMFAP